MASEKQIEANRLNGQKSRGPTSEAGKSISRLNALKHGLTGSGIGVDDRAAEAIAERKDAWRRKFEITNPEKETTFHHMVVASVIYDRGFNSALIHQKEHAARAKLVWDTDRRAEAEVLATRLTKAPGGVRRQLEASKHGVELLIEHWEYLAASLDDDTDWDETERSYALDLLGVPAHLRKGRTPVDAPKGGESIAFRKALLSQQIERLRRSKAESLDSLDAIDRKNAEATYGAEFTKAGQLIQRYQREAYNRFMKAKEELRGKPGLEPRNRSPRLPLPEELDEETEAESDELTWEEERRLVAEMEALPQRVDPPQPTPPVPVASKTTFFGGSLVPASRPRNRHEYRAAQAKARRGLT